MRNIISTINKAFRSKVSVYVLILFYLGGGINHFLNPAFYLPLIPEYLPFHNFINVISGVAEIVLALGIVFKPTRKIASYLIVLMLIAFIPAHIYFIQLGSCIAEGLCVAKWIGWLRLVIVHPILIYWALLVGKSATR